MTQNGKCSKTRVFNLNSMLPKIEKLRSLLINSNISALGITETKSDNNEEEGIEGYNLVRSDTKRKGGGIACYIKTSISFNYHRSLSEHLEIF